MAAAIIAGIAAGSAAVVMPLRNSESAGAELTLTKLSETSTTITLGWTPQPGFGYLFSADGGLVSRTNDATRSTVRFAKGAASYEVAVIVKGLTGTYPPPEPPPTTTAPTTTAPTTTTTPTGGTAPWLGSFNASYQAAPAGTTISVPAGTYAGQTVSGTKSPAVTFTMAGPVTVNGTLRVEANGLVLKGGGVLSVTYIAVWGATNFTADAVDGTHFDVFETNGPVKITNGDWGPCQAPRDDASCLSRIGSGSNVTVEGNSFHNITSTDLANYHVDGFAVFGGANNKLIRNRFYGNMITNIRVQTCCGNPQVSNLLLEGNAFQAAVSGQGAKNGNGIDIDTTVPGLRVAFNSFEQGTYIQNTAPSNSGATYVGNLYSHVSCLPGVTYSYNVFVPWSDTQGQQGCSSSDTKVTSLGYAVFPGLLASAPGIDKGGSSCGPLDLYGDPRPVGAACDAGAVER